MAQSRVRVVAEMYLTDYNLRDGEQVSVRLLRSPCLNMGGRTMTYAKTNCSVNVVLTPVYECRRLRLCTPFDSNVDDGSDGNIRLLASCQGCKFYERPATSLG